MPPDLITALNRDGGIRMFASGDYRGMNPVKRADGSVTSDFEQVQTMLDHAQQKGLYIKAITKQEDLVKHFGDHPNLRINISTDELPKGMTNAPTLKEALKWAGDRPNVKIRSVAMNWKQLEEHLANESIDVVTAYHGPTNFAGGKRNNKMFRIIELGNPKLVERSGRDAILKETDSWVDIRPNSNRFKELAKKYSGRLCCTGKKCPAGATKCGFGVGMATLIAGIALPEFEIEDEE